MLYNAGINDSVFFRGIRSKSDEIHFRLNDNYTHCCHVIVDSFYAENV